MALSIARRAMRPALRVGACTRGMDWIALAGKVSTDAAKSEVSRLRDLHSDLASYANSVAEAPEPIDFAHFRNVIKTPGLVDSIEKDYNAMKLPAFENSVAAEAEST